jgi:hypothetical protein
MGAFISSVVPSAEATLDRGAAMSCGVIPSLTFETQCGPCLTSKPFAHVVLAFPKEFIVD